jgi:predicted enzyme related to lactoylglutathione lyase
MTRHIPVMSIYVPDLAAAERFYTETLGFAVKARYGPDITTLTNTGSMIVLERARPGESPRVAPGIEVADIGKAYAEFKAKGATMVDAGPRPFPVGMAFTMRDCAGNQLEVLEFRRS